MRNGRHNWTVRPSKNAARAIAPFTAALATVLLIAGTLPDIVGAQPPASSQAAVQSGALAYPASGSGEGALATDWGAQWQSLRHVLLRLPVAAVLSSILAFRPRRRGTPKRQTAVIQTQIILAIVGAIVMLVVGASLARAFGIVGAAGLIRYRAKIEDPKDAGVMLCTLAIGLASGVGLYLLAAFTSVFVLGILSMLESLEPAPYALFELTVKARDSSDLKSGIEQTLRRYRIPFELRATSAEDLSFEVKVPLRRDTDSVSSAIAALAPDQTIEVKWEKKKEK